MVQPATEPADAIDAIAGERADAPLRLARELRPDVAGYTRGSYRALLEPADEGGVSRRERELIALRAAVLASSPQIAEHHRERLRALGSSPDALAAVEQFPGGAELPEREALILRHVDMMTLAPHTASRAAIERLVAGGLSPRDVVTIAQLVAFMSYEVRALAGLRLLAGEAGPQEQPAPLAIPKRAGFTIDTVAWDSWLPTVDLASATPEQVAVLEESLPTAKTSPYYLLLVHDVDALRQRSRLFNKIMYAPGGLRRADRELATVAVSRINGCVYCASVHAQRYAQLSKRPDVAQRLLDEGVGTELGERERAVTDLAVKLTLAPQQLAAGDLDPLRRLGLSDLEILDTIYAAAMFAWANRLLQTLGEVVRPPQAA